MNVSIAQRASGLRRRLLANLGRATRRQVRFTLLIGALSLGLFREVLQPLAWRRTVHAEFYRQLRQPQGGGLSTVLATASPIGAALVNLARNACLRAFLGKLVLILLESPVQRPGFLVELLTPLLNAIAAVGSEGTAVIWFTQSDMIWNDRSSPASHRLHLHDHGLVPARREQDAPAL
jgi:hypothetical protein